MSAQTRLHHLLHRAAFGPRLAEWPHWQALSPEAAWQRLRREADPVQPLTVDLPEPMVRTEIRQMGTEERQAFRQQRLQAVRNLNVAWLERMARGPAPLRERMTLFWHDHFACRLNLPRLVYPQNETLRQHALGKFGDLLLAIARDPGMLVFLNNQQNRKAHPNENFARELLELFTLGRGHYSESDVKAAARAFTGWGFNREGFVFRRWQHDDGEKIFLGLTGNWGGEDIIRILLAQKQTARHLVWKLYRYLVNPEVDEVQAEAWATFWYEHDYDIGALLDEMFTSSHFYEMRHMGARVKSPIEYLVGLMGVLDLQLTDPMGYLRIQRVLGQVLFQPPNVAGWPEHLAWIDSSSLMTRLGLPQAIISQNGLEIEAKASFAGNEDAFPSQPGKNRFDAHISWQKLLDQFPETEAGDQALRDFLLRLSRPLLSPQQISHLATEDTPLSRMQARCMSLLATPEYQFC